VPSVTLVILRGLARRCPRCGLGKLFTGWFRFPERCPRCGLRFEREEGAFLGSLTINYAVTGMAFFALLIGWMVVGGPDVRWVPLVASSVAVVLIVPLVFYPFAKTIWAAIDYLIQRTEPGYVEPDWRHGDPPSRDPRSIAPGGPSDSIPPA
jgi:uncharacterized protein (DUF983 family)